VSTVCANDEQLRQNHFICAYFPFKTKGVFLFTDGEMLRMRYVRNRKRTTIEAMRPGKLNAQMANDEVRNAASPTASKQRTTSDNQKKLRPLFVKLRNLQNKSIIVE
jgi:hypothetical protein